MAATELAPGAPFGRGGRFRLEQLLGTGGMASVWRARDTLLDRTVAIKVLSDVLALDGGYVRRFRREGQVAARLAHPNLVRVYDLGQAGDRPFLVMEYVAGGTLADRLAAPAARPWSAEQLFAELLDALEYIHAAGIVHRDIKPANVLIGSDGRARLTDFGIAQPSDASQLTRTGLVLGTQRYIAPEVLRGGRANSRSDIYSCGVMFGQCLQEPAPERLRALVGAMTAEDPARRPASAAAPAAMLSAAAATPPGGGRPALAATRVLRPTEPTLAREPPAQRRGREIRVKLPRSSLAALAAIVLVVVLVVVLGSGGSSPARRPTPSPPASSATLRQNLGYLQQAIGRASR
jgi:hypothetical protein